MTATANSLPQALQDEFVGVSHGDFDRVRTMLAAYPALVNAVATWGETPIQAATQTASVPIMQLLLTAGAPLDICAAAVLGLRDRVAQMLQANPALKDATGAHDIPVLYFPAIVGNQEIAELLLSHGADPNAGQGGNTPLHGAVQFGQTALVEWLLRNGAFHSPLDYEGKTPMERAREAGRLDVMRALRSYGAT
ncbi:MAG TPA: ankyrin repeat domain-containing protein [Chloroflexia bacterium]|nr:ankyrin repeat domain-containing protein [Chloroflexia bacterium]